MSSTRLPWTKLAPKAYQAMATVSMSIVSSTLGAKLLELVRMRVSQINACAFCLDMHARELRKQGETWQRINSLPAWREVSFYDERERAALDWAEALTRVADGHGAQDAVFDALQASFNEQEIVDLSWAIAAINTWNRMSIGMRAAPSDQPMT